MESAITLPVLTRQWLQESLGVINEDTLRQYAWFMEQYVYPKFGDRLSVSGEEALGFFNELMEGGKSASMSYTIVRILRKVLEYGASIGACQEPGWDLDISTPGRKREVVILSSEEEQQLTRALIDNPTSRNLGIFLMLTAGLRPGEVVELQWKDIVFNKREVKVKSERGTVNKKNKTIRTIPLGERQMLYLRKMKSQPDNYLCSGTPEQLSRQKLEQTFIRLLRKELLPPIALMELRHTYAVRSIETGMSYDLLASRLGVLNSRHFRSFYGSFVDEEQKRRLESEQLAGRKVRQAPKTRARGSQDPEATPYRIKLEKRRNELKEELESLEGELAILRHLRYSDCVQGMHRKAFYDFIGRVLPGDKDAQFAVDYLRANMRVEDMSYRKITTPQAIRRRVTHGFEKLASRIQELEAVEGWEMLPLFNTLCDRIQAVAPPALKRTGPKAKPTLENRLKAALAALDRIEKTLRSTELE